jgi:lipocalin
VFPLSDIHGFYVLVFVCFIAFAMFAVLSLALAACPPADFMPQTGFDLNAYIAKPWFIQQQAETKYLPASQNRCVSATYSKGKSFWGYDLKVHNVAYDVAPPHAVHDSGTYICAKVKDGADGKLAVAPCFLPTFAAGPYWVLHFDDAKGFAVISGGPPTLESNGKCKNDPAATNGSGFWIFTRAQERDEAVIAEARDVAEKLGFDLSVLSEVDQTDCPAIPPVGAATTVELI